jgi:hypothetical protein
MTTPSPRSGREEHAIAQPANPSPSAAGRSTPDRCGGVLAGILYWISSNQKAIIDLARALRDLTGNLPPLPGVFPDYRAPIVRNGDVGARELAIAGIAVALQDAAIVAQVCGRAIARPVVLNRYATIGGLTPPNVRSSRA